MRVRRALLYMPGNSRRKIDKAVSLRPDSICMDLEDGVAINQKEAARSVVRTALTDLDFGRSEKLVRLNPYGSGLDADDFEVTVAGRPDGFVLPKVESGEALRWLDERITAVERARPWPANSIVMVAIVETARAVVRLREICEASPRLQALIFGAEDLASSVGATRTPEASEVFYARSAVVMHAAAYGLQAIDMVYADFQDQEGLAREAEQGARLGFAGKQAIHPSQIVPIQRAFSPGPSAVANARRIIEAHNAHLASGIGAFALDGKMVDAPVVKAAELVLARARAAAENDGSTNADN